MRLCRITCAVLFGFVAITGALGGSEQFSKIRRLVASESETSLLVTSSKPLFQWQLTNDPSPQNISLVTRKPKRRGRKKNRNNLASSTMMVPPEANSTVLLVKPKRRKGKKRKNRKNKKKNPGINILEVTTARNFNLSKILTTNSTLSDLIQQLNKNPHENLVENTFKQTIIEVPQSSNTSKLINLHISMESSTTRRTKRRNRCSKNNGGCAHNCHLKGPRKCSCLDGFALAKDKRNCLDIDECVVNNAGCEQICKNTLGSYSCACKPGLRLSHNQKSCEDLNECLLRNGHGPCQDACQNTFGSYTCTCSNLNGTTLSEDGHNCVDNDECTLGKSECSHKCINAFGRSFCACPEGMELSSDWKTCQDVNECEDEVIAGKCQGCVNTDGSYICLENSGYQNEQPLGSLKQIACKALFPPRHGFISCSRKGALTSYTKSGRKRTKNSPGTTCKLNCPVGYRMRGQFHLTCGFSGVWQGKSNAKCIRGKPPFLKCPNDVVVNGTDFTTVNFAEPESNINWKYVKGHPAWTKGLSGNFSIGSHIVRFSVKDPTTKLMAFCSFKIVVVPNT